MQEDKQDTERTDVLHQEEIDVEIARHTQCTIVCKLVVYQFMRYEPSDQDTCQETYHRQENLTCHEVEDIEQRFLEEVQRGTCGTQ